MKNALDLLWTTLMNSDVIKFAIDTVTFLVEAINKVTKSLGSFGGSITGIILSFAAFKGGGKLVKTALKSLGLATKSTDKDVKNLGATLLKFAKDLDTPDKQIKKISKSFQDFFSSRKTSSKEIVNNVNQVEKALEGATQKTDNLTKSNERNLGATLRNTVAQYGMALAYAAVIAAAVVLVKTIEELIITDKERLTQLTKLAEAQQESIETTIQLMQELESSVAKIGEQESELETLTKGTAEWKKVLVEVNNEVLSLINKYPELVNYVKRTDLGNLAIDDAGYDLILEKLIVIP